jgi:glycosyltransferase involved in cell wall biosynthesis
MSLTLSIIVPAYNVERYIDQCLESILDQIGPSHELIVLDDGSRDGTLARITALSKQHSDINFSVIAQANQGISATRNNGIAAARGDYIAFVDSDDVLLPGALAVIGEAIALHRPDVVVCDFHMWRPEKESKSRRIAMGYPAATVLRERDVILKTFFADRHMYVWAHVFRRAVYQALGTVIFPPGRVFEDVATLPRLLSECATLVYMPQPIVDYRQHPTSITRVITEQWCLDFASALSLAREHLDKRALSPSVRDHFDIAAAYFYIGVVKNSYQLPGPMGRRVREEIREIFRRSVYGDCASMLAAVRGRTTVSHNRKQDIAIIGQVNSALTGSIAFSFRQAASRKLKLWQRLRRTRKAS